MHALVSRYRSAAHKDSLPESHSRRAAAPAGADPPLAIAGGGRPCDFLALAKTGSPCWVGCGGYCCHRDRVYLDNCTRAENDVTYPEAKGAWTRLCFGELMQVCSQA
ncbi:unnamed protein product [Ectocarpus sp. 12 AP-2014]